MSTPHFLRRQLASGLLVATVVVSGCASIGEPVVAHDVPAADITSAPELIPVMRSGRYMLAELAPTAAQRDLLLQVVDVVMPEDAHATVGDGLRHVLKRSGYQLCPPTPAIADLYELPLPAAHLRLGPMTLRDALLTLAGSAWVVDVDESKRQVCFSRHGDTPAIVAGEQP
jgi:type IV pili sensor histidine kinase/response regulator